MSKRTKFTTISPLPRGITREVVREFLHSHEEMIDLNPLVKERHRIDTPSHATSDEVHCTWYSLTDKISYLPGGLANGHVTYTCAFHDLPNGIQTHCYAPAGLNIRDKWTLNGSLPGEPIEPVELGTGAPVTGLYIREDVDMRCNVIMTNFVKKTLIRSHAALIERLKTNARLVSATKANARLTSGLSASRTLSSSVFTHPPSVQSCIPESRGKTDKPTRILPSYTSPLSTAPSSGFPIRQVQYTLTPPPVGGCTSRGRPNRDKPQCHPLPSPHYNPQHSSPLAYGRDAYHSSPPKQQHKPIAPQEQNPDHALVPAPLRLGQYSARSGGSTASTGSAAHDHNSPAAIRAQSSVQYRVCHPDYPHMSPYADDHDRQVQRQDSVGGVRGLAADRITVYNAEATLRDPFVAELDGWRSA